MKRLLVICLVLCAFRDIKAVTFTRELFSSNSFYVRLTDSPFLAYRTFLHNNVYSYAALEMITISKTVRGLDAAMFLLHFKNRQIKQFESYASDPLVIMAEYFFTFYLPGRQKRPVYFAVGVGSLVGMTIDWEILSVLGAGTFSIRDLQEVDYTDVPVINIITVPLISLRGVIRL